MFKKNTDDLFYQKTAVIEIKVPLCNLYYIDSVMLRVKGLYNNV